MTAPVQQYEVRISYGVVRIEAIDVARVVERPSIRHFINAGTYLIQSDVCQMVPRDRAYDMPDLINKLIGAKKRVICFPIREYWLDVGQMEQYERASTDIVMGII